MDKVTKFQRKCREHWVKHPHQMLVFFILIIPLFVFATILEFLMFVACDLYDSVRNHCKDGWYQITEMFSGVWKDYRKKLDKLK